MVAYRSALVALVFLPLLASAPPARAQAPHEAWRTLELPHFRVHYPAASEAWARRTASRLEAVRARLQEEIGYAPPQTVEVIVADPLSRPNGSAVPFLGRPRMVLWTTPPEPGSVLGHYRDWGELLAVHEEAHLVHLLRPSRSPWRRLLARLLPAGGLGPVTLAAPRWVTEGYATLLEGRLTGAGRPGSDLRAAILRQRARAGRLPSYGALGSGDRSWLGRSMAYLAGSAFLEWLEDRAAGADGPGEDALRDLWARMTARRSRSFEEAFRGVFGEGPDELYGRFTAELTWRAMEAERRVERRVDRGPGEAGGRDAETDELWLDLSWTTGTPAVSPDGDRLAAVVRHRERPDRLTVWETAPDREAADRREDERRRLLERDPEDVPAVETGPPPRKEVASLPAFDGREPLDPRWAPDGESLLFWALAPDPDGFLRADLYRWVLENGEPGAVDRLTRRADVRHPDPLPGEPRRAVAVRNRHGLSGLVVVDLETGAVRDLNEPSVEEVWATPRISPGGDRLAAVRLAEGRWRLVVAEIRSIGDGGLSLGEVRELPTPVGATVADPAWGPDGRVLYAAVGGGGFLDLWGFDVGTREDGAPEAGARRIPRRLTRRLTQSGGAALAPAPTPDGEALFYLSLEHDGLDIWQVELRRAGGPPYGPGRDGAPSGAPRPGLPPELAPAIVPPPTAAAPGIGSYPEAELPADRPYGAGPQELTLLAGLALAPSGLAVEAGVRGGDVVGRLDWLLLGSAGTSGAVEGGVLSAAWRGLPVELSGAVFAASEEPTDQEVGPAPEVGILFDRELSGASVAARWDRRLPAGAVVARLGLFGARVHPLGPLGPGRRREARDTAAATLRAGLAWRPSRGRWSLPVDLGGTFQEGETDSEPWRRWEVRTGAGVTRDEAALRLAWERHGSDDLRFGFDRFHVGGVRRSLLPVDADFVRVPVPALPTGYLVGDEHEGQRLELRLEALGAPLVFERHRVWSDGGAKGEWLSLAGVELQGALPPTPLLGLPAARFTAGAAYVLDDPAGELQDEVRLWAAIAWRP